MLYPGRIGIDPALLHLEQAMCLAREHSVSEACQLARETYLAVPADHRTQILDARAAEIIKLTPVKARPLAARELGEASGRTAAGAPGAPGDPPGRSRDPVASTVHPGR
ncbi:hypothetical protein ACPC54_09600 [Kitasatospora sp. NPDC094028]